MSALAAASLAIVLIVLAAMAFGPGAVRALRARGRRRRHERPPARYDPGLERRAERRGRDLMRAVVGEREYAMYVELGFIQVAGPPGGRRGGGYGYLIYPHRPIVAYDAESGEPLSEYCVNFPDRSGLGEPRERLPDADDVLAKWMALHGDERGLLGEANMHLLGRQVDPGHVRRDLRRLTAWDARRATPRGAGPGAGTAPDPRRRRA